MSVIGSKQLSNRLKAEKMPKKSAKEVDYQKQYERAKVYFTLVLVFATAVLGMTIYLLTQSITCYQTVMYDNNERTAKVVNCK